MAGIFVTEATRRIAPASVRRGIRLREAAVRNVRFVMIAVIAAGMVTGPVTGVAFASRDGHVAMRTVSSRTYDASVSIPASWRPTPYYAGEVAYDGASGWMEFDAATGSGGLRRACEDVATGNVLHPYGLHPRLVFRTIAGRPGCLIYPSPDAVRQSRRAGGPVFAISSALVSYRHPVSIGGTSYALFEVDADPSHLVAITDSLRLRS
jgi:hypothetical protein